VRQETRSFSDGTRQVGDVARNLRIYANDVQDSAIAAKLLAAASELDAREQAQRSLRVDIC